MKRGNGCGSISLASNGKYRVRAPVVGHLGYFDTVEEGESVLRGALAEVAAGNVPDALRPVGRNKVNRLNKAKRREVFLVGGTASVTYICNLISIRERRSIFRKH